MSEYQPTARRPIADLFRATARRHFDRLPRPSPGSLSPGSLVEAASATIAVGAKPETHMPEKRTVILVDQIEPLIVDVRGHKVLMDRDLAALYGVAIGRLNEQVRRNRARFPDDFVFQLTKEEADSLRSQIATLKTGRGRHRKYLPYAFTEYGAIMAATVLNSPRAVEVSVFVVRAFVKLRHLALTHAELAAKLAGLERTVSGHDDTIRQLVVAIRQLMAPPPEKPKRRIGFGRHAE
jgi:hypothetical protein